MKSDDRWPLSFRLHHLFAFSFSLFLIVVWSYLALSDGYVIEDDEDDLDLEVMFVDDRLYRAWLHVHVQQSSILFVAVAIVVAVVVVVEGCRLTMDRLKE
jgi:hypothetical protein